MKQYFGSSHKGLTILKFDPIVKLKCENVRGIVSDINYDLIWHAGWFSRSLATHRPNWNGFMQKATSNGSNEEDKATISFLPVIDLNPSDKNCIFSTLSFIMEQAKQMNIEVPYVTFDQPLWLKAVGIIEDSRLPIVCRLGGFHTLMSFLGSIGNMMKGSGLEELFAEVYAENSVVHMFSGKAISRVLRAHILAESALTTMLINILIEEGYGDIELFEQVVNQILGDNNDAAKMDEFFQSDLFLSLSTFLSTLKEKLSNQSRTAKLWIAYMNYIQIVKRFTIAERTSNWLLHLEATTEMLNLFAASGHINYAKSARLYIQQMRALPETHPWLQHYFISGAHAVRRSTRNWAGLWSDLVIEQTLMRSIKSRGGLTRGRGMSEAVRHLWVLSLNHLGSVHQAMTQLSGTLLNTSEQHVEMGVTRKSKDYADCKKFLNWHQERNPFNFEDEHLHSLSSGLVSKCTHDEVNCEKAEELGDQIQNKLDKVAVTNAKISRKDQLLPLKSLSNSIKVEGKAVSINPTLLFTRLSAIVQREEENVENYFSFEMTHEPMALFKEGYMRKPDKPALRKVLMPDNDDTKITQLNPSAIYTIDGGALLHRVRWVKDATLRSWLYTM